MISCSSAAIVEDGLAYTIIKLFYPGLVMVLLKDIEVKAGP